MAVGASGSTQNARQMARATARELSALGINMNLAPVVDVNSNPRNPVIGIRSFGSDPATVADLGVATIDSYQAEGIIATAKHFPGHGDTNIDSHVALPIARRDLVTLHATDLVPFQAAIDAGVPAIMTGHIALPALTGDRELPATLSPAVLRDLLRVEMGFQGVIVSDSMTMNALYANYGVETAAEMAFRAGVDILAFGADVGRSTQEQHRAYVHLVRLYEAGLLPEERLDDSVRRVLRLKARYGLLDWRPVDVDAVGQRVGTEAHRHLADRLALEGITLVRDEPGLVPLPPGGPILVVWPQGVPDLIPTLSRYRSGVLGLHVSMNPKLDEIARVKEMAATASVVIVGTYDARQHPRQQVLVDSLLARPLIVVALGNPHDLVHFTEVNTYMTTFGNVPSTPHALAKILTGLAHPTGRLPVDLPPLYGRGRRAGG
jgi:beta-N-acetylhexosaminidase